MKKTNTLKDVRTFAKTIGLSVIVPKTPRSGEKYRIQGYKTKMYAGNIKEATYLIESRIRSLKRK